MIPNNNDSGEFSRLKSVLLAVFAVLLFTIGISWLFEEGGSRIAILALFLIGSFFTYLSGYMLIRGFFIDIKDILEGARRPEREAESPVEELAES